MTLETERNSRDYLFGRLLAVAERIEERALYLAGEKRDTNAAKFFQRFSDRPHSTWASIEKLLKPYMSRLQSKRPPELWKLKGLIDEIVCKFNPSSDFMNDRRLSGEFLLGYHCQRHELNPVTTVHIASEESTTLQEK